MFNVAPFFPTITPLPMSNPRNIAGPSTKRLPTKTTIYNTDTRERARSGGKNQRKATYSYKTIPTRLGIVEGLSDPKAPEDLHAPLAQPSIPLDNQDWVDEELDEIPSNKKVSM
jgi:hypothetical protein